MVDEENLDRFQIALMRWQALDGIVAGAHKCAELYDDIDPALVEAVVDACRADDDIDLIIEALVNFWDAVIEAAGLSQAS